MCAYNISTDGGAGRRRRRRGRIGRWRGGGDVVNFVMGNYCNYTRCRGNGVDVEDRRIIIEYDHTLHRRRRRCRVPSSIAVHRIITHKHTCACAYTSGLRRYCPAIPHRPRTWRRHIGDEMALSTNAHNILQCTSVLCMFLFVCVCVCVCLRVCVRVCRCVCDCFLSFDCAAVLFITFYLTPTTDLPRGAYYYIRIIVYTVFWRLLYYVYKYYKRIYACVVQCYTPAPI